MWEPLKQACDELGLITGRDVDFGEAKLTCTCLKTGAMLRLVGYDDRGEIGKLRGLPFDEVALDEASLCDPRLLEHLVHRVIEPRLGDRLGTIVIGGTPEHTLRGLFYDATRPGSKLHCPYAELQKAENADFAGWTSHAWTLEDVSKLPEATKRFPALVNLWNDALFKKAKNRWSDTHPIWQREYLGKWAADNTDTVYRYRPHIDGKPWNEWDPFDGQRLEGIQQLKAAVAALPKIPSAWHFAVGMDMGTSDPFAANVFAFNPYDRERNLWHVMSFEHVSRPRRDAGHKDDAVAEQPIHAKAIAELLLGKDLNTEKLGGIFGITGWPDVAVFDSDESTINELKIVYGAQFKRAERKRDYKAGAIELVNGDLLDGRIKILKGSPLATQLSELQWQEDEFGMLRENKAQANHSADCLLYSRIGIAELFESGAIEHPPEPVVRDSGQPDFVSATADRRAAKQQGDPFDDFFGGNDNFDSMFKDEF